MTLLPICDSHLPLLSNLTYQLALLTFKDHVTFDPYNILGDGNINTSFGQLDGSLVRQAYVESHLFEFNKHWIAMYGNPSHRESIIFASFYIAN
ncbi:hypothetical protein AMTRI_Chr12g270000 [Amborella trichopoda]